MNKYGSIDKWCKVCRNKHNLEWHYKNPHRSWAIATKNHHIKDGIQVYMTIDELESAAKAHGKCMICGEDLHYGKKNGSVVMNSPTLDRMNNEDYIDNNNSMVLCLRCNLTKQDRTMEQFLDYCERVLVKFNRR
jgi:hypothetical protein